MANAKRTNAKLMERGAGEPDCFQGPWSAVAVDFVSLGAALHSERPDDE
jgi:hypothetical protein